MFAIRAEGHRAFAQCPCGEFLVRLHQPVRPRAHDDGAQAVEHVIGPAGGGGDVGVQADQGVAQMGFDQHLLRLAGKVGEGDVMPAETRNPAARAGKAGGELRRAGRGRAREKVAQMGFDGVGFVELHTRQASNTFSEICA